MKSVLTSSKQEMQMMNVTCGTINALAYKSKKLRKGTWQIVAYHICSILTDD